MVIVIGDAKPKKPVKGGMMIIKKPVTTLIRGLDPDVWKLFKLAALKAGKSANQLIKDLIQREADKQK